MKAEKYFDDERSYLFAIAYRMLGSAADADDMVQEAWLRWQRTDSAAIERPKAWLARTVTRLCLDRLRELKRRREEYVGPWLPEPLMQEAPPDGGELAESLNLAFLTLLERLTPVERAVFLLRQVFAYDYSEIAEIVGKSEPNCRQLLTRAQKHIAGDRPRYESSPEAQRRMIDSFLQAAGSGDIKQLEGLLREDVELWSDGGGKATAAYNVLRGREVVAKFFHGLSHRPPPELTVEFAPVNGQLGALLKEGGRLTTVLLFQIVEGQAHRIHAIRNPDKLQRIAASN